MDKSIRKIGVLTRFTAFNGKRNFGLFPKRLKSASTIKCVIIRPIKVADTYISDWLLPLKNSLNMVFDLYLEIIAKNIGF